MSFVGFLKWVAGVSIAMIVAVQFQINPWIAFTIFMLGSLSEKASQINP